MNIAWQVQNKKTILQFRSCRPQLFNQNPIWTKW